MIVILISLPSTVGGSVVVVVVIGGEAVLVDVVVSLSNIMGSLDDAVIRVEM